LSAVEGHIARAEKYIPNFEKKRSQATAHFGKLGVDGRKLLKCMLGRWVLRV
jgi:hypothetical protein